MNLGAGDFGAYEYMNRVVPFSAVEHHPLWLVSLDFVREWI